MAMSLATSVPAPPRDRRPHQENPPGVSARTSREALCAARESPGVARGYREGEASGSPRDSTDAETTTTRRVPPVRMGGTDLAGRPGRALARRHRDGIRASLCGLPLHHAGAGSLGGRGPRQAGGAVAPSLGRRLTIPARGACPPRRPVAGRLSRTLRPAREIGRPIPTRACGPSPCCGPPCAGRPCAPSGWSAGPGCRRRTH
jgi:hypothetical protein